MLFVCRDKNADIRTNHIHVVRSGSNEWYNYINFRNYLRAKHEALKLRLMSEHLINRLAYYAFCTHVLIWSHSSTNPRFKPSISNLSRIIMD